MKTDSEINNIYSIKYPNKYMVYITFFKEDSSDTSKSWGLYLRELIEAFNIPRELIGSLNLRGEIIPDRIYPVFYDEVPHTAKADFSESILDARNRSQFLIVLCSPRAAQSKHINQTILHFKQTGKADRIMAVILQGQPKNFLEDNKIEDSKFIDPLQCFPEALRYNLDANRELDKSSQAEPLAIDVRLPDGGNGITNPDIYKQSLLNKGLSKKDVERLVIAYEEKINRAKLKIISGILGVMLEASS